MTPHTSLRILLADDCASVRKDIRALLEAEAVDVVGEAADGHEAVRLAKTQDPDVAVLDLVMPLLNGIETARQLRQESARTRVLVLTVHREEYQIARAFAAGVDGYVAKTDVGEELARAIDEVFHGNRYLSSAVSRLVAGRRWARWTVPEGVNAAYPPSKGRR